MGDLQNQILFVDELPFPEVNAQLYREIYEYEQLLRRLAHAALVAKAGVKWSGLLPVGLLPELKKRLNSLSNRIHLSCENSRNPVWITTLEELRAILTMESIWAIVREFSGYQKTFLESKLSEVIEIRNVIGHNRAATPATMVVWRGIATSLRPGLEAFKSTLLYRGTDEVHLETETPANAVIRGYSERCRDNDWSRFQPMLSESKYFYSLTHLPVDTTGDWVRVASLLTAFASSATNVFSFMVNKSGNEFSVVWPKGVTDLEHEQIIEAFWSAAPHMWTETRYEDQSAAYVCDPQVWFYENQRPIKE